MPSPKAIYNYVDQMKHFLANEGFSSHPVSASLVMEFHRVTRLPVMQCKQFLAQFDSAGQCEALEVAQMYAEQGIVHDPIENDPAIRPLFKTICEEADQITQIWHQQRIRECPEITDFMGKGQGLCHLYWVEVKRLLWKRH
ncbi:MAG: hypothetical protein F6J87_21420 [Spirulina sp. SIO3F2]|nr:hypothetical protein [Spirulina sp. SIO3F2]